MKLGTRINTVLGTGLCIALLLSACAGAPTSIGGSGASDPPVRQTMQMPEKPPREETETITTKPGEVIDAGTSFVKYNLLYEETEQKGTFERIEYTTDVYEDGNTYSKYCNVYLPYGYDPNSDTKYDVLYFQHGNTNDPEVLATD